MNTPETQHIIERFFISLDAIIAKGSIEGVSTYCRLYDIDRRNMSAQRKDLSRRLLQPSWLVPLVREYGVSAKWILTGIGRMFENQNWYAENQ